MKLKKVKIEKTKKEKINKMLFLLFCVITLSLSVGYAVLNEDLNISGEATFRVEEDIRITNVNLLETTNLGIENYKSKYGKNSITLGVSLPNIDSTVTYKVEIINGGTVSMWIDSITQEINNNPNMEYILEGLGVRELINPGETKEFNLKIKYKEGITLPDNTNLDTVLKFNFIKPVSILAKGNNGNVETTFFNNGPITKESVETMTFLPTLEVGVDAIGYWDVSENLNGTVIAWYTDKDNNGLYELNIGGIGKIYANQDSSYTFYSFINLESINFNTYYDTSNVINMLGIFNGCSSLVSLDLTSFNTSLVTDMSNMFSFCNKIQELNISTFNTENVINMSSMFSGCKLLEALDIKKFNTSHVTNMQQMFSNCSSLLSLDVNNFNTSNVVSMQSMFQGCSKLKMLDLSNFNTSKVTNMKYMFSGLSNLSDLYIDNFNTSRVTNMAGTFYNCSSLKTLNVNNFDTSKVINMGGMFAKCLNLIELDLSNWNVSNVTIQYELGGAGGMFDSCTNLKNINLAGWNVSKITSFYQMFRNCSSLISLDLSSFNTSSATNMGTMFQECTSLKNLNITNFDTSRVTNMENMFRDCKSLETIDLSNFNTENVISMLGMFYSCTSLKNLNLSNFYTPRLSNIKEMFRGCISLKNLYFKMNFDNISDSENAFTTIPKEVNIYVKDETTKSFILSINPDLNNIQIIESL